MRTVLQQYNLIIECVEKEEGIFSLMMPERGKWIASIVYGREAEDSHMAGAHGIGTGKDATEAIDDMLDQMGRPQ